MIPRAPGSRSQSALEYMMTYGWAILVIVIVAGVLYSLGIFSPSSSAGTTVTGFSGLGSPTALCMANGGLRLQLGDNLGTTINITGINVTVNGATSTTRPNQTISPQGTYIFYVPNVCGTNAGAKYSFTSTVTYTEPGQTFAGPYFSSGAASGTVSSTNLPPELPQFFGQNSTVGGSPPISLIQKDIFMNTSSKTFSLWVYLDSIQGVNAVQPFVTLSCGQMSPVGLYQGRIVGAVWNTADIQSGPVQAGEWYYVVLSYNNANSNESLYLDGVSVGGNSVSESWPNGIICLQVGYPNGHPLSMYTSYGPVGVGSTIDGFVADFQYYNSSLTASQVQQLYAEGLTGTPLSGQKLEIWWPLNGTAKDYSGYGLDGTPTAITFTSNYPAP